LAKKFRFKNTFSFRNQIFERVFLQNIENPKFDAVDSKFDVIDSKFGLFKYQTINPEEQNINVTKWLAGKSIKEIQELMKG
jgi:hypothetical protein